MSGLLCMGCGAGLDASADDSGSLTCAACGAVHAYEVAPSGAVSANALRPGEQVLAEWGGRWWRGEILEQVDEGRWRVRFAGWSDEHAQVLGVERLADVGGAPMRRWWVLLVVAGIAVLVGAGVLLASKGDLVGNEATQVDAATVLEVGQAVEVEREGRWVAAEVVAVQGDAGVLVRYLDRGTEELVGRGRLRVP